MLMCAWLVSDPFGRWKEIHAGSDMSRSVANCVSCWRGYGTFVLKRLVPYTHCLQEKYMVPSGSLGLGHGLLLLVTSLLQFWETLPPEIRVRSILFSTPSRQNPGARLVTVL
ncbi:hypothetical protein TNCV_3254441 [Trichonephila clavipes]|nr:hypothetical protein TNCV_3254441 [Trichonephila clavipes]